MPDSVSSPGPIITLLTDFGTQDYFVGAMKGVILSINPEARFVDVTHETPPQDIEAAAFNLLACYRDFPSGTIHVAVVDPGVGSKRRALMIQCASQFFVGPDNGLFSWICEQEKDYVVRHITSEQFFRQPVSSTFHGRDVFAPVAAHLSKGAKTEEFGPIIDDFVRLDSLEPRASAGTIEGRIIHVDRFGNCVTNFTAEHFGEQLGSGASLRINKQRVSGFRQFFAQAKSQSEERLFMILGSAGFIEIAAQDDSAASILKAQRGDRVAFAETSKSKMNK